MMTKAKMMMMMIMFMILGVVDAANVAESTKVPIGLKETKLSNVILPKPMSDFSTVYDATNNHIYISGGCDSIKGNEYNMEFGIFTCNNISNNHYMIDVNDIAGDTTKASVSFTPLANMPMARYRHTAVLLPSSQQIVLIGGRNVIDDSILPTVDIYNIQNDTWTSHNITDPKYLLSDNTGLEYMNRIYIFGGWNGSYTAQSTSFYVTISNDDSSLNFTDIAELPTPRGDISSVLYTSPSQTETYALVTGGFTHESFCYALDTVEQYSFDTNEWISESFDTLNIARGDKVLVRTSYTSEMDDDDDDTQHFIYALGGERPIENFCDTFGEINTTLEAGSETVPIDDIEYYNVMDNSWTTFPNNDIDVFRFRFSAAVDTQTNVIYTLGGQLAFNKSCICFPTSNEIYMYTEIFQDDDDDDTDNANPPASSPNSKTNGDQSSDGPNYWSSTMKMTMMITIVATIIAFIRIE